MIADGSETNLTMESLKWLEGSLQVPEVSKLGEVVENGFHS